MLMSNITKEDIQKVSNKLTDKQKIYLGLLLKGYSHLEIGQMFGITRQKARKEYV